jgi:predicted MPP superfamily phosphohydrolase
LLLMTSVRDDRFVVAIKDRDGNRVAGADVKFFVDGVDFGGPPETRDSDPSIQAPPGHQVSARVRYGTFEQTVELSKEKATVVAVPGVVEELRILHLTDLHVGQAWQRDYFPSIKQSFFADLRRCHEEAGPWDLVVFSGDLTFSGQAEQFKELDEFLEELLEFLGELGEKPIFLAVPGNHDLCRPSDQNDPIVTEFREIGELPDEATRSREAWDSITQDPTSKQRIAIDRMFANYVEWWKPWARRAKKQLSGFRHGLLPGEFAATLVKGECRFGIVGLNSTVLQAAGGDYRGRLAIHIRQFNEIVPKKEKNWPDTCDAALLMTHQPPDWLSPYNLENVFKPHIAKSGRFAAHICGHMHIARSEVSALGGSDARRIALGRSLFSMELEGGAMLRLFGYAAYQIVVSRMKQDGIVRAWPRKATKTDGGDWFFGPDQRFQLESDNGTPDLPANYFRRPNAQRIVRKRRSG